MDLLQLLSPSILHLCDTNVSFLTNSQKIHILYYSYSIFYFLKILSIECYSTVGINTLKSHVTTNTCCNTMKYYQHKEKMHLKLIVMLWAPDLRSDI